MDRLAPVGDVYQAGTLSGNPVAAAAGIATLRQLDHGVYAHLESMGERLEARLADAVAYHGCSMHRVGSMFTIFTCENAPTDFQGVLACDLDAFGVFFRSALAGGVYLPPSQFEAAFLSARLTPDRIDRIADGLTAALVAAFKD